MESELFQHLIEALPRLAQLGTRTLCVATPYLTSAGLAAFVDALGEEAINGSRWLTSLTLANALSGATAPAAILRLGRLGASVRSLDSLHAKLYLLPTGSSQILGSANLTKGGLHANEEIVLWNTDFQLTSRAMELFDEWWAKGHDVTSAEAHELRREAERAEGLQESATALLRLMAMGAFVTITTETPDVRQQQSIRWEDIGVPEPARTYFRPTPPTLMLWPPEMRGAAERVKRYCRHWLEENSAEYEGRFFLPRSLFRDLDGTIQQEEQRFRALAGRITKEQWREHQESLGTQLREWLVQVAEDQSRRPVWAEQKVESLLSDIPSPGDLRDGFRINRRFDVPHPDSGVDLVALAETISRRLPDRQERLLDMP